MCLYITKNYKPEESKTRKHVYKVVFKKIGSKIYTNLFGNAHGTRYYLNKLSKSTRDSATILSNEETNIEYGFHTFVKLNDAKKFVSSLNTYCSDWDLIDHVNNSDFELAILKCEVKFENHVADGLFDINDYSFEDNVGKVKSAVYHEIKPIKEVYSKAYVRNVRKNLD